MWRWAFSLVLLASIAWAAEFDTLILRNSGLTNGNLVGSDSNHKLVNATPQPTSTPPNTPVPTATARPTDTPAPTATPANTPVSTATAVSTPTPRPTDTPIPTATAYLAYDTIEDEATPLAKERTLNFIGDPITCVDNAGATRTDCTLVTPTPRNTDTPAPTATPRATDTPGAGSGGYATIQDEGTPLPQETTFNCIGSYITCADDAGNTRTNLTVITPTPQPTETLVPTATPRSTDTPAPTATPPGALTGVTTLTYSGALSVTGLNAISASATPAAGDRIIKCTSGSSSDVTYTMPAATGTGRVIDVCKVDSGTKSCIESRAGSDTLNGATTRTLNTQYFCDTCVDFGTNYWQCRGNGI